jgi:hypothetical protein
LGLEKRSLEKFVRENNLNPNLVNKRSNDGPKLNSFNKTPMRVKGIQKTPSSKSITAKLRKNMFFTDCIPLSAHNVFITNELPNMDNKNIMLY